MIIIVFALFLATLLGIMHNCRDDSLVLHRQYLHLKDSLYVVSSKVQDQASFERLDDSVYLGGASYRCKCEFEKCKNCRQIYSFPFYMSFFVGHENECGFVYVLDQNFSLSIKGIPVALEMIELYSNKKPLESPDNKISLESANEFWPCFKVSVEGYIL